MNHSNPPRSRTRLVCTIVFALTLLVGACSTNNAAETQPPQPDTAAVSSTPPDTTGSDATASPVTTIVDTDAIATRATAPPGGDGSYWLGHGEMSDTAIELAWDLGNEPNATATVYRIERGNGIDVETLDLANATLVYAGTDSGFVDTDVTQGVFYLYILEPVVDGASLPRRFTETLAVTDVTPPSRVAGLVAVANENGVLLTWEPSSDDVEFASYAVYVVEDDELTYIGGGAGEDATRFLDNAPPVGLARYSVVAVDFHDNRSEPRTVDVDLTAPPSVDASGLFWGPDPTPPDPSWTKPAINTASTDPAYGTTVRRVTSADGTRFDRNTYSRRQAENTAGTLFMTYHGDAEYHVYDRETTALVAALPIHPDAEPQWHATDPDVVRYIAGPGDGTGDLKVYEINVRSGDIAIAADFAQAIKAVWPNASYMLDRAEGSPSADGNRYAWIVYSTDNDILGMATADVAEGRLLGTRPLDPAAGRLDFISISPSGEYVVAGYESGVFSYSASLDLVATLHDKAEHSDIAIAADGSDIYVFIDFGTGWLTAVNLVTQERTPIFDIFDGGNTSIHISGKGFEKPGWVLVSTYSCKVPEGAWTCNKVMAIELAPNGRILNLAHTYNCGEDYWTETHAVVNRSFTRAYFNSDSGSCGIDAEVYELTIPAFP